MPNLARLLYPLARTIILTTAMLAVSGPARADAWDDALKDGRRFIPVELWTGAEWDGARDLAMKPADLLFGERGRKRLVGPVPWTHPETGRTVQVYRRLNRDKEQLFTVRSQKDGLGRVFDNRRGDETCSDGIKFPLGWWREGETRRYTFPCSDRMREVVLTIEKLDYEYGGMPHSLRFRWVVDGGRGRDSDMTYIYAPGRGLVDLKVN